MRIQYASDLHLEFRGNSDFIQLNPLQVAGEVLVLAGDITLFGRNKYMNSPFFDWCSENYKQTFIIPGNHEYYDGVDLSESLTDFEMMIRPNVRYLNNKSVKVGDVELFFTTLWCIVPPEDVLPVQLGITDCHRINYKSRRFVAENYADVHSVCMKWLRRALEISDAGRKIVVSHHCPTYRFVDPRFITSNVNSAFCVNMDDFIESSGVDYWIYGHTHFNGGTGSCIGNTVMLCNQLGYVKYGENKSFQKDCFIELVSW